MWTDKYVGIPYKPNGRDINGLDCWGLVRLIYSDEYNIQLPSFSSEYTIDDDLRIKELFAQYKEGWEQQQVPETGSLILFRVLGAETHVGVVVDSSKFIHVREGSDCVIDSFVSGKWAKRVVGFYKYHPKNSIVLTSAPHPLRTEKWVDSIPEGSNIEDIYLLINKKYNVAEPLAKTVNIMVNGCVIPKESWSTTILKANDVVEYRAVPGKEALKIAALIALVIIAPTIVAGLETVLGLQGLTVAGANLAGGLVAASSLTFVGSLVASAIIMAGSYLINAIAPVRPPSIEDPGSPQQMNLITGTQNVYNPYGAIPIVLGKIRFTPPVGAKNYAVYADNGTDQYLHMLLLWGYGPLTIYEDTIKIGEVLWSEYEFNTSLPNGGKIILDRKTVPTQQELDNFDKIYGEDVQQQYSGVEMTGPTAAEAGGSTNQGFFETVAYAMLGDQYTLEFDSLTGLRTLPSNPGQPDYYDERPFGD